MNNNLQRDAIAAAIDVLNEERVIAYPTEAVFGVAVGLFAKKFAIKDGGFDAKNIVLFNIVQVVANAVAWILVAPVLDIVIYAEPANKVFAQGAWAFLGNIIIAGILGSLIAVGYSKIGGKSSSLSKED